MEEGDIEYEVFAKPEPVAKKKKLDEDGNEIDDNDESAAQEEGDPEEKKKPKFVKEDMRWTVTDRKPKNLPQLF